MLVPGYVMHAETSTVSLVKGGKVIFATVKYYFEYRGKVYKSSRLVCDSVSSVSARTSEFERVRYIEQLVLKLKSAKQINVWIRKDAPDLSCLLRDDLLTEYK